MNLFAYGSLMKPEILRKLIGRVPEMQEATLKGFGLAQHGVERFKKYRLAVPRRGSSVGGKILVISRAEFKVIHEYERTPERIWGLKRIVVSVGRKKIKAYAYLANKKFYSWGGAL